MKINHFGHIALYTNNYDGMLDFYCNGLGLEYVYTLPMRDLYRDTKKLMDAPDTSEEKKAEFAAQLALWEEQLDQPWLTYIKIAEGQFIELFRGDQILERANALASDPFRTGYAHMCIEVEDIKEAVKEIESKGLKFRRPVSYGPDCSYQAWIDDPDGNQIELMEYTSESYELYGNPNEKK